MTKQALYGWTDYPFVELGDVPHEPAPLRSCTMVAYDGDKYVSVIVAGIRTHMKAGYCYKTKSDAKNHKSFSRSELARIERASL